MKLIATVAPTIEPVTLDQARAQCNLYDDATHDATLSRLITAARSSIEGASGVRCLTQTVRLELDSFPDGDLDLGVYPVASITSVAYDDEAGATQTLVANTGYWADLGGMYPRILPVTAWPATLSGKPGCVRVTMVVGYTSADAVPADLRHAVLMRVTEMFERRGESIEAVTVSSVPVAVDLLIAPHRRLVI